MKWINGRLYEQEIIEFGTGENYDQTVNIPDSEIGTIKDLNPMNLYIKNLVNPWICYDQPSVCGLSFPHTRLVFNLIIFKLDNQINLNMLLFSATGD